MSFASILFSRERKPAVAESINRPDEILQNSLTFVGGTVFVRGGLQIDAKLKNVSVESMDRKPIVLTALGKMENCFIKGEDVLICGDFSGEIHAQGDVEITNTARARGVVLTRGHVLLSPMASEPEDIKVARLKDDEPTVVMPKEATAPTPMANVIGTEG